MSNYRPGKSQFILLGLLNEEKLVALRVRVLFITTRRPTIVVGTIVSRPTLILHKFAVETRGGPSPFSSASVRLIPTSKGTSINDIDKTINTSPSTAVHATYGYLKKFFNIPGPQCECHLWMVPQ